jgi:predicted transcriptional regulator
LLSDLSTDNTTLDSVNNTTLASVDLPSVTSSDVTHLSPTSTHVPIVRSVDKVSSSLPNTISLSEDYIRASVGFRRIDTLKKHLSTLYQPTVKLANSPDAVLDAGDVATL